MNFSKIYLILSITLSAFPLFKLSHYSILMILWILLSFYRAFKKKQLPSFLKEKKTLLSIASLIALFAIYILYLPFYSNLAEMGKLLTKALPILLFPIGFVLNRDVIDQYFVRIFLQIFVWATIFTNILGWGGVFHYGIAEAWMTNDFYHPTFRTIFSETTRLHIPYLGLFSAFSALILIYKMLFSTTHKAYSIAVIFLIFSMYIYSARMALGIFLLAFIYLLWRKIKSLKSKIFIAILLPLLSVAVIFFSPIKERYVDSLQTQWVLPHQGQQPHQVNYRYGIWHCSSILIWQNIWTGVGVDKVQQALDECYSNFTYRSYEDFSQKKYNTHNQYIDWILKFGITTSIILFFNLFFFVQRKDILYQVFLLTIIFSFLTENILDRQAGIVFYSLFNTIFALYKTKRFETNTCSRLVR